MSIRVYQYPKCSTCRKATRWLDERGIDYEAINIVDAPPSTAILRAAQRAAGAPVRTLFNTSGQSYRNGNFKERLSSMTEAEAFAALAADGKLIKRPLLIGDGVALVGFREPEWEAALG